MKKIRVYFSICLAVIFMVTFCSSIVNAVSFIMDDSTMAALNSASNKVCNDMNIEPFNMAVEISVDGLDGAGTKVCCVFNGGAYDKLNKKQKKEYIKSVMYIITREEPLNAAQTQQAYNFLVSVDDAYINTAVQSLLDNSRGNMLEAIIIMTPVVEVVNTIMGILIIVTLLLTVFITVTDLAYIGTPFLQTGGKEDKKPRFVSNDAYKSLQKSEENGTNVYGEYFKKRFFVFIILSLCVSIIVSGKLGEFVSTIIGFFV